MTTLTKRLAEDLSNYFREAGLRCKWLHSELDAIERVQVLRELREGAFDVLVGVNLLREGLDLPEVSLVAILDADKEGFLRSGTSLIQTIGRAARNVNAEVILYADRVTDSMQRAMDETQPAPRAAAGVQRRARHHAGDGASRRSAWASRTRSRPTSSSQEAAGQKADDYVTEEYLEELHAEMLAAAANLQFERAAELRDRIAQLKGQPTAAPQAEASRGGGSGDERLNHRDTETQRGRKAEAGPQELALRLPCVLCGEDSDLGRSGKAPSYSQSIRATPSTTSRWTTTHTRTRVGPEPGFGTTSIVTHSFPSLDTSRMS